MIKRLMYLNRKTAKLPIIDTISRGVEISK